MSSSLATPSLDALLATVRVLDNPAAAQLADGMQFRFVQDLAYKIYPNEEIASRWGFVDVPDMCLFLAKHPQLVARVTALRAVHESDSSVEERGRLKAQHGVEHATASITNMVNDTTLPADVRLKAHALLLKQAGFDGGGRADKAVPPGTQFQLVMRFNGAAPHTINATVVDQVAAPEITTVVGTDDDDALNEDV